MHRYIINKIINNAKNYFNNISCYQSFNLNIKVNIKYSSHFVRPETGKRSDPYSRSGVLTCPCCWGRVETSPVTVVGCCCPPVYPAYGDTAAAAVATVAHFPRRGGTAASRHTGSCYSAGGCPGSPAGPLSDYPGGYFCPGPGGCSDGRRWRWAAAIVYWGTVGTHPRGTWAAGGEDSDSEI